MGVRPVAVGSDDAADLAVVEGEGPEVLGEQDDRVALALVGIDRVSLPRRLKRYGLDG